jgi:ATP synthase protein I
MPFNRPIPDRNPQPKSSSGMGALIQAETLLQIAFILPSAAVIGWLAGAWLDSRFHQSWIGIGGLVFGFISGMVYVIRLALSAEKKSPPDADAGDASAEGSPKSKS